MTNFIYTSQFLCKFEPREKKKSLTQTSIRGVTQEWRVEGTNSRRSSTRREDSRRRRQIRLMKMEKRRRKKKKKSVCGWGGSVGCPKKPKKNQPHASQQVLHTHTHTPDPWFTLNTHTENGRSLASPLAELLSPSRTPSLTSLWPPPRYRCCLLTHTQIIASSYSSGGWAE